ncbi:MAG: hypothetical protein P4L52_03930 [Acidocella sp.]|nr:hypothetical protein [Acidocella sp.]MDR3718963.1 hypothetical protein [Bryobacteraceae bacterium]
MSGNGIREAIAAALTDVPGCLAIAFIDISAGVALHIGTATELPPQVQDHLPAASAGLFDHEGLALFDAQISGAAAVKPPRELIANTETTTHVFLRGQTYPDYGAVFVCSRDANFGYLLYKARAALAQIEATF